MCEAASSGGQALGLPDPKVVLEVVRRQAWATRRIFLVKEAQARGRERMAAVWAARLRRRAATEVLVRDPPKKAHLVECMPTHRHVPIRLRQLTQVSAYGALEADGRIRAATAVPPLLLAPLLHRPLREVAGRRHRICLLGPRTKKIDSPRYGGGVRLESFGACRRRGGVSRVEARWRQQGKLVR